MQSFLRWLDSLPLLVKHVVLFPAKLAVLYVAFLVGWLMIAGVGQVTGAVMLIITLLGIVWSAVHYSQDQKRP